MRRSIGFTAIYLLSVLAMGCYPAERSMYIEKNNTAFITLSHYTSKLPFLGPCGFSRSENVYHISTPRTFGMIPSNELKIFRFSAENKIVDYTGYIEFISENKLLVNLFINENGKQIPLTINGKHKMEVTPDEIYMGPDHGR